MVIDFHTHTFPDSVAPRAIAQLSERGGIKPHNEGTLSALKESMRKNGVDISVILPVATSVHQVESINRTAAALNGRDEVLRKDVEEAAMICLAHRRNYSQPPPPPEPVISKVI